MEKYMDWYIAKNKKNALAYQPKTETFIEFKIDDYIKDKEKCLLFLNEYLNSKAVKTKKTLDLTLVMTHKCNLKCIYCFEKDNISEKVLSNDSFNLDILVEYLRGLVRSKNIEKLIIRFFGGEPTIEMDRINQIMQKITMFFPAMHVVGVIFTNAYLLDDDKCIQLKQSEISMVHTTLDGYGFEHNLHKKNLQGNDTFERIFENISNSLRYFKVTIRINVSRLNLNNMIKLFEKLSILEYKKNIRLDIRKLNNKYIGLDTPYLTEEEFIPLQKYYINEAIKLGLQCIILPYKENYCVAVNENAMIIETDGNLIRCTEEIGDKSRQYSNIQNSYFDESEYSKWIPKVYHSECNRCVYLNLCMGKCPQKMVREARMSCNFNEEYFVDLIYLKHKQALLRG